MSWLDSMLSYGSSVAAPTDSNAMSTAAPASWIKQVQAQPGYNPLASEAGNTVLPDAGQGFLGSLFGSMFDKTDANGIKTQGWGGLALSGLQGLGNSFMAMKQYGLAEDALKEQKRQFDMNFNAQRNLTNSQLSDRQRARVASNPGAYQSVGDYMKEYGV